MPELGHFYAFLCVSQIFASSAPLCPGMFTSIMSLRGLEQWSPIPIKKPPSLLQQRFKPAVRKFDARTEGLAFFSVLFKVNLEIFRAVTRTLSKTQGLRNAVFSKIILFSLIGESYETITIFLYSLFIL